MTGPVTLEIADGVARIGLARPERRNALDMGLARGLREKLREVHGDPEVGAVVLFGQGDNFCVGGDLAGFADAEDSSAFVAELAGAAHEVILAVRALDAPVVSAVHGACAGAGLGLALAADIIVAEEDARFVAAYTAVGLSPDCGVTWALSRAIGPARASDLILTNRQVTGGEAVEMGLVSRLAKPGSALSEAEEIAKSLAAGPRSALAASAQLVRSGLTAELPAHLDAEAASIAAMMAADGAEGVAAFLEKRRPDFRNQARSET